MNRSRGEPPRHRPVARPEGREFAGTARLVERADVNTVVHDPRRGRDPAEPGLSEEGGAPLHGAVERAHPVHAPVPSPHEDGPGEDCGRREPPHPRVRPPNPARRVVQCEQAVHRRHVHEPVGDRGRRGNLADPDIRVPEKLVAVRGLGIESARIPAAPAEPEHGIREAGAWRRVAHRVRCGIITRVRPRDGVPVLEHEERNPHVREVPSARRPVPEEQAGEARGRRQPARRDDAGDTDSATIIPPGPHVQAADRRPLQRRRPRRVRREPVGDCDGGPVVRPVPDLVENPHARGALPGDRWGHPRGQQKQCRHSDRGTTQKLQTHRNRPSSKLDIIPICLTV